MVLPVVFSLSPNKDPSYGIINIQTVKVIEEQFVVEHRTVIENGEKYVQGTVKNAEGKALPGANIVAVGRTYGTVSGRDGAFKLKIEDDASKIAFSFIGYVTKEITF